VIHGGGYQAAAVDSCSRAQAPVGNAFRPLTANQLTSPMAMVASRMADFVKSTRASNTAQISTPRAGRIIPPGRRQADAPGWLGNRYANRGVVKDARHGRQSHVPGEVRQLREPPHEDGKHHDRDVRRAKSRVHGGKHRGEITELREREQAARDGEHIGADVTVYRYERPDGDERRAGGPHQHPGDVGERAIAVSGIGQRGDHDQLQQ
jgi:hypothetical protein